jgi:mannose-6-phosphate isomerase-like protein (cupin superfamily)
MKKINFKSKFEKFNDLWSPKVIAEMNDYQFKLVKIKDDFVWHEHNDTDEVFIVISGVIWIEFKDETIQINTGEMIVVPKGTKHRPYATEEAQIMLVEPKGVVNTGDIESDLTALNDQWI